MAYFVLNDRSCKLSIAVIEDTVSIDYFSIFDMDTFESESHSLSFPLDVVREAFSNYSAKGSLEVKNEDGETFSVTKKGEVANISLGVPSSSSMICDVNINIDSINKYLNS